MDQGLFRKAALDKVSSPEQLDLLMRVTSPIGWLALVTVGVMIATVGVWAVVGSIADLVDGRGTLFRGERLYDVKANMAGTLVALNVRPGAQISAGQVIASIRRDRAGIEERDADEITIENNEAMARKKRGELATLQRQRGMQQQLVNQGIKAAKDLLLLDRDIIGVQGEIESLEREARLLRARMQATAELRAAEPGRVVEVIKSAGDKVREDEPVLRIEPLASTQGQYCGGNVHAILYVPASQAGKVRRGQVARVSPSDVKKEEYGYIFGTIEWIASYPASTADMTEKLKNDQLVASFVSSGPVFEARVCLQLDPTNRANAFKWSSSQGPPKSIDAGTTCSVSVVVEERKPYTYVIPAVRRTVGL